MTTTAPGPIGLAPNPVFGGRTVSTEDALRATLRGLDYPSKSMPGTHRAFHSHHLDAVVERVLPLLDTIAAGDRLPAPTVAAVDHMHDPTPWLNISGITDNGFDVKIELDPEHDPAARAALQVYADATTNPDVREQIVNALARLDESAPITHMPEPRQKVTLGWTNPDGTPIACAVEYLTAEPHAHSADLYFDNAQQANIVLTQLLAKAYELVGAPEEVMDAGEPYLLTFMSGPLRHPARLANALLSIVGERAAQDHRWGDQSGHDDGTWTNILVEEVGELSKAMLHDTYGGPKAGTARDEAVQIAAVATALVERYDLIDATNAARNRMAEAGHAAPLDLAGTPAQGMDNAADLLDAQQDRADRDAATTDPED